MPIAAWPAPTARAWVAAAVAEFGGVDILYNNASALRNGALMDLSDEDWHFTIRNELDTPETARFTDDPDGPLPAILAKIPLGRYGQADAAAELAAFLASDDHAALPASPPGSGAGRFSVDWPADSGWPSR